MSMSNVPETAKNLAIGSVISRSLSIVFSKFHIFTGLILVAFSPLLVLLVITFSSVGHTNIEFLPPPMLFLFGILWFVVTPLVQGATTITTFRVLRSEPVSIFASLRAVWPRLIQFLLTCLLFAIVVGGAAFLSVILAIVFGFPLLMVVGIVISVYLFCRLYMTIPVCLVEKLGARESLGRAAELSEGVRWTIFFLVCVSFLIAGVVEILFGVVETVAMTVPILGIIISLAASLISLVFSQAFSSSVVAIAYFDLRNTKEGIDVDSLVNVFD